MIVTTEATRKDRIGSSMLSSEICRLSFGRYDDAIIDRYITNKTRTKIFVRESPFYDDWDNFKMMMSL